MTRGVWGDPERYSRRTGFPGRLDDKFWASVDEDGYWYLHGRSDDTLNIAGKRRPGRPSSRARQSRTLQSPRRQR